MISMLPTIKKTDFIYSYSGKSIEYSIWSTGGNESVKTIIYLGTVQIDRMPVWVAEHCPPNTIVVQGAPHWFTKDDGSDTHQFMFEFAKNSFTNICKTFPISKAYIITDSQAAPAAMRLFALKAYSPYLIAMALLQPLGFNSFVYSGSDRERIRVFKKRVATNARYQLLSLISDSRLRYNHRLLAKTVGHRGTKTQAQYNSGLMYDGIRDLRHLQEVNIKIVIICGANDKIFPPNEIRDNLYRHHINVAVQSVRGIPHSPLATKHGQKLLMKAFDYFSKL